MGETFSFKLASYSCQSWCFVLATFHGEMLYYIWGSTLLDSMQINPYPAWKISLHLMRGSVQLYQSEFLTWDCQSCECIILYMHAWVYQNIGNLTVWTHATVQYTGMRRTTHLYSPHRRAWNWNSDVQENEYLYWDHFLLPVIYTELEFAIIADSCRDLVDHFANSLYLPFVHPSSDSVSSKPSSLGLVIWSATSVF